MSAGWVGASGRLVDLYVYAGQIDQPDAMPTVVAELLDSGDGSCPEVAEQRGVVQRRRNSNLARVITQL